MTCRARARAGRDCWRPSPERACPEGGGAAAGVTLPGSARGSQPAGASLPGSPCRAQPGTVTLPGSPRGGQPAGARFAYIRQQRPSPVSRCCRPRWVHALKFPKCPRVLFRLRRVTKERAAQQSTGLRLSPAPAGSISLNDYNHD